MQFIQMISTIYDNIIYPVTNNDNNNENCSNSNVSIQNLSIRHWIICVILLYAIGYIAALSIGCIAVTPSVESVLIGMQCVILVFK